MKFIDDFLNNITMYRLLLYVLITLNGVGAVFSFLGFLPFNGTTFIISVLFILAVSLLSNDIFARTFDTQTNVESVYISALILSLLISPAKNLHDLIFLGWAATLTTASKYILTIGKKHIFNPVAIAIVLTSLVLGSSAVWWVGTSSMFPFVLIGGLLIVRKIKREDLFYSFLVSALVVMVSANIVNGTLNMSLFKKIFIDFPIIFFGTIMLTEPLTTPPTKKLRIWYGAIVGFLFAPQIHIGSFYTTPELALIAGNIFSYIVSPKEKLILTLKQVQKIGDNLYDYVFLPDKQFSFVPGQYMEWTLGHTHPDARGNRRYFTLASTPGDATVRLGIRFYNPGSSFKKALLQMNVGSKIVAGQRSGDFVLPDNPSQKIVFVAGGIGITPFRSMVKHLIDTKQRRDIVLFYSNKTAGEIAYADVFTAAHTQFGLKTIYALTDREHLPAGWKGAVGRIDAAMIAREVPDYKERIFYLSGPYTLVKAFETTLRAMGIPEHQIKTDFFPGFM